MLRCWLYLPRAGSHNRLPAKSKPDRLIQCYYRRHWNLSSQANVRMCSISELETDVPFFPVAVTRNWQQTFNTVSNFFSSRGVDDTSGQKCCCQAWFRHIRPSCFSAKGKEWVWLIAVTYQEGQEGRLTETGQSVVSKRVRLHGMGTLAPVSHSSTHSKISHSHL